MYPLNKDMSKQPHESKIAKEVFAEPKFNAGQQDNRAHGIYIMPKSRR